MPSRKYHNKSRSGCSQCKARRIKCDEIRPRCQKCTRADLACSFKAESSPVELVPSCREGGAGRCSLANQSKTITLAQNLSNQPAVPQRPRANRTESEHTPVSGATLPACGKHEGNEDGERPEYDGTDVAAHLLDLELMHAYSVDTWKTLACRHELDELLQRTAPQLSFSNPVLMHSMLALAGQYKIHFHIASLELDVSDSKWMTLRARASYHQERAVQLCMQNIGVASQEGLLNHEALCLACLMLPTITLASYQLVNPSAGIMYYVDRAIEYFRLTRGIGALIEQHMSHIARGPLWVLLGLLDIDSLPSLDPETNKALNTLYQEVAASITEDGNGTSNDGHSADGSTRKSNSLLVSRQAVVGLRKMFQALSARPKDSAQIFGWIQGDMINSFTSSLQRRDPPSLAILAHWAVALNSLNSEWWELGLGRGIVNEVRHLLAGAFEKSMVWPLRQVHLE